MGRIPFLWTLAMAVKECHQRSPETRYISPMERNSNVKLRRTPLAHASVPLLFCPLLTCHRRNCKGFTRQEKLQEHIRRQHRELCNTPELVRKRKVEVDEKESFEEIKR